MEGAYRDKYAFIGEWFDHRASLIRRYNIFYYPIDDSLEMFDMKNNKIFVKRIQVNGVRLENFFIGSTLHIFGRLIKIIDFACEDTRKKIQRDSQRVFALVYPLETRITGSILTLISDNGLHVTKLKKTVMNIEDITFILRNRVNDPVYQFVIELLKGGAVYGIEIVGKDILSRLTKVIGNSDPSKAELGTIRALYATDPVHNCIHVSSTLEEAQKDIDYFFPPPAVQPTRLFLTATLSNCTLCIIKPHIVREGTFGKVMSAIDEGGFNVTACNMLIVDGVNAAEFYEVYKGIVTEYQGMVEELASGACIAMEVAAKDKNVNTATEFRKLVGPSDPEIARLLRPHTLRAKFGKTKVQNAVHCSDLAEDGLLEVEYFFKILST